MTFVVMKNIISFKPCIANVKILQRLVTHGQNITHLKGTFDVEIFTIMQNQGLRNFNRIFLKCFLSS